MEIVNMINGTQQKIKPMPFLALRKCSGRQNGCFLATLESDNICCKPIPTQPENVVVIY